LGLGFFVKRLALLVIADDEAALIGQRERGGETDGAVHAIVQDGLHELVAVDGEARFFLAQLGHVVLIAAHDGGKDRARRAHGRTKVAVANGGVDLVGAACGILLDALQHGEQPPEAVAEVGAAFIDGHVDLPFLWVMVTLVTVEPRLDECGAGIGDVLGGFAVVSLFCLLGADAGERGLQQRLGIRQAIEDGMHEVAGQLGRKAVDVTIAPLGGGRGDCREQRFQGKEGVRDVLRPDDFQVLEVLPDVVGKLAHGGDVPKAHRDPRSIGRQAKDIEARTVIVDGRSAGLGRLEQFLDRK